MTRTRLLSLDAMRGLAALAVMLHHIEREYSISLGFPYGYLGVDFFFLMSGFVIANAYEARMDAGMKLDTFLLVRLKRVYPMIFLGALIGIAAGLQRHYAAKIMVLGELSALTILPMLWSADALFPLNIPEWSLFFELIANVSHRLLRPILNLLVVGLVIVLALLGLGVAGWKLHALANGWSPGTLWGGFPRAFFSYFIGILIYRLSASGRLRLPSIPLPWPLLAFLAVVVFEGLIGHRISASLYLLVTIAIAFPLIFLFVANARVPAAFAGLARGLGDLSYPLYAVHVPLLMLCDPIVLHFTGLERYGAAVVTGCSVVVIALLLDRLYDRPIRKWLAGRSRLDAPPADVEVAAP